MSSKTSGGWMSAGAKVTVALRMCRGKPEEGVVMTMEKV
jgi:hypothetical protein